MKVLEEPKETGPRSYTFHCGKTRCRAKLQASEHEGRFHSDQRAGDCLEFTCPRCGTSTYVDVSGYDGR